MVARQEINPDWARSSVVRISQAVRHGNTIYTSGQVAYDETGNIVGGRDMGPQATQTFDNIRQVLAAAGAKMDDVVKITAFITDMSQYGAYAAARTAAFPDNIPASSTVSVPVLVDPELMVEVEAVAIVDD